MVLDGVRGSGQYVGTYLALTTLERYWWGEGEFKFYIDGNREYPTICGTGTEDYFGGSWSFAKQVNGKTVEQNYCTPYMGYPYYSEPQNPLIPGNTNETGGGKPGIRQSRESRIRRSWSRESHPWRSRRWRQPSECRPEERVASRKRPRP